MSCGHGFEWAEVEVVVPGGFVVDARGSMLVLCLAVGRSRAR